jgi:hypothetical protein
MLESSKSHDISPITKKTNKKLCESTFIHGLPIFVLYEKCVEKMKVHEFGTLQVPKLKKCLLRWILNFVDLYGEP